MEIFILSDGYIGGASNFLEQHILYNVKKKNTVYVFDKNYKKTFPNLKKNKFLKCIRFDPIKDHLKLKKIYYDLKNKHIYFFFTNPIILILYFIFFLRNNINKVILTLHSGIFNWSWKSLIAIPIFSLISLKLDFIIFGSISAKNWWYSKFPWMKKIKNKIIYNGIDFPEIIHKKKLKKIRISFIGRLEKENNPLLFVNLANKMSDNKKFIFNIFGDGSFKNLLKKRATRINFWGWEKRSIIYKNTDIVVILSPVNNFPYVALEAIAHGKPVLTNSLGDIRNIIKNNLNGVVLNNSSFAVLVAKINFIANNYYKFSKNGLLMSRKFDVTESCSKFWNFITNANYYFRKKRFFIQ